MADPHDKSEDGNYMVVARRYRPRGFDELVGQEHVCRALKNAIETSRVGHAYLFTGARGVGKTSAARIFAKALNNESGPSTTPDNESDVALAIDAGQDIDVIEIDGASHNGVDHVRALRANAGVRPSRARFKIYIIDEVHMLSSSSFNALLKTLEEPPDHVKFIFCTTNPEKIPITVLSRCQTFDFAPVEVPKIVTRLREIVIAESAEADDAALELIARRAAGSMRDSQSLLEQVLSFSHGQLSADHVHSMLGTADDARLHALALAMANRNTAEAIRSLDESIDAGIDAGRLAEQLLCYFRDLMAVTVGCDPSLLRHTSASLHGELKELGESWGLQTVLAVVGLIDQTLVRIKTSVYSRVLLEATLIQICNLPNLQNIANLAAAADNAALPASQKKKPALAHPRRPTIADATATPSSNGNTEPPEGAGKSPTDSPDPQQATTEKAFKQDSESKRTEDSNAHQAETEHKPSESNGGTSKGQVRPTSTELNTKRTAVASSSNWDQATAQKAWKSALGDLESMTETFARVVTKVVALGTGQLRLEFPSNGGLAMKRCELPEHRSAITKAISLRAGRDITLDFHLATAVAEPKKSESGINKTTRIQRIREIEDNELVRSCIDQFNAEIVRIDKAN